MKTKDECLLEAQNHFGVKVFDNDDGITRRIEHRAMELYASEQVRASERLRAQDAASAINEANQLREQIAQLRERIKFLEPLSEGNFEQANELNDQDHEIQRLTKEVELLTTELNLAEELDKSRLDKIESLRELLDRIAMTLEIYNTGEDANIVALLSEYKALNHKP